MSAGVRTKPVSGWPEPTSTTPCLVGVGGSVEEKSARLSRKQALGGNNNKAGMGGGGGHKESQIKLDTSTEY